MTAYILGTTLRYMLMGLVLVSSITHADDFSNYMQSQNEWQQQAHQQPAGQTAYQAMSQQAQDQQMYQPQQMYRQDQSMYQTQKEW